MGKKDTRPNWILRIAGVLLCLVLLSMHMTSGMYARYSTTTTVADSARVARFEVKETGTFTQDLLLEYYPGAENTYTVEVKNSSEVAVKCSVSVQRLSNNIPIEVSVDGDITNVEFAPNDTASKSLTMKLTWPSNENDAAYSYEVDAFRVIVNAEQLD